MQHKSAFCHAPNFSIGARIFSIINEALAHIMDARSEYQPSILEVHHTEKKDSPSGTAIALANQIIGSMDRLTDWTLEAPDNHELPIEAQRQGDVKGIHRIDYMMGRMTTSVSGILPRPGVDLLLAR